MFQVKTESTHFLMYNTKIYCENSRVDSWLLSSMENPYIQNISTISKFSVFNSGMNCFKNDSSSEGSVDTAKYVNMQKSQSRKNPMNRRKFSINKERNTEIKQKNASPHQLKNQKLKQKAPTDKYAVENGIKRTDYLTMFQANLKKQNKNNTKQSKKKVSDNQYQTDDNGTPKPIDIYTPRKKLSTKNRNITINRDELIDIIGINATNEVLQSSKSLTFSENSKIIYIPPEKDSDLSESDDDVFLKLKHRGFLRSVKG